MTNDEGMMKPEIRKQGAIFFDVRASSLFRHSSFVIPPPPMFTRDLTMLSYGSPNPAPVERAQP
jgi:hypothetical protein